MDFYDADLVTQHASVLLIGSHRELLHLRHTFLVATGSHEHILQLRFQIAKLLIVVWHTCLQLLEQLLQQHLIVLCEIN